MADDTVIYGPGGDTLLGPVAETRELRDQVDDLKEQLVEAAYDRRLAERRAEEYAYEVLSGDADRQQRADLKAKDRRRLAKQAREIWAVDPQAGASVDLMNDFTFGRGVPHPQANDEQVQEVLDDAWSDPDNQIVLTSYEAQIKRGTDLSLQSNVFFLLFDQGDDGRVKLGLLNHDTVDDAVRDPQMRQRVLYYLTREVEERWDYQNDRPEVDPQMKAKIVYYEHWHNVSWAQEQGVKVKRPPREKVGEGGVYHVSINATGEMVFGVPIMRRLVRWFTAFNSFMASRVDLTKAAAALIMKRTVKGGPEAVQRMAAKEISRTGYGELSGLAPTSEMERRAPGSVLVENESVTHEPFSLPTNASNAMQDSQMIRSQISAATRFPQAYYGDASNSNLATATSLELPVLKAVESRQEVWEGVFRWFCDRVIERAVEVGRLSSALTPDEFQEAVHERARETLQEEYGDRLDQMPEEERKRLTEAHEDKAADEVETQRDLAYEFKMPNPLRRLLSDLIGAITNIAKTFDPNGTNVELSRFLLGVALAEGLEVENPRAVVDQVMPEDYVDPAMAAFQAQQAAQGGPGPPEEEQGFQGAEGEQHTEANPYGAPMRSRKPEEVAQEAMLTVVNTPRQATEWREVRTTLGRGGEPITLMREARYRELSDHEKARGEQRKQRVGRHFDEDVLEVARRALERHDGAREFVNGGPK
jgi:IS5 family transposase